MQIDLLQVALGSGLFSILVALIIAWWVNKQSKGTDKMNEIAGYIRTGAYAFLKRQYKTISIIGVIVAVLLWIVFGWQTGFSFILGVASSLVAGFLGMDVATRANVRTANAARKSLNAAIKVSFMGGLVMGLAVMGLSLIGVTSLYMLFGNPQLIVGFGFGASLAALFAQLGGGIYTKAADIGADLVGKIEKGIPEDDPRNPAVIADLVGDNVGDCAGRGADLFESMTAENIGAMVLGIAFMHVFGIYGIIFPLLARTVGIYATMIGAFFVSGKEGKNPMNALRKGLFVTAIVAAIAFYPLVMGTLGNINYYYISLIGIVASILIGLITEYYTAKHYRPVRNIAKSSHTGAATNIITGFSIALEASALPVVVICFALLASFMLGGLYGTAVATMGMLATTGIILAMDVFGPITDNAGGIVEMSGLDEKTRYRTDSLDSVGNTTKALTKGYAMGVAALSAFLLFSAYFELAKLTSIDIAKPVVFVGAFLGALLPFLFSSFAIRAVGKAAEDMISEVRRQFREIPGIMKGKAKPDYAKCVDISVKASLREMILPGLLVVAAPIAVGMLLKAEAAGGFLIGATISGILLAMTMNTGGGAWDNAKKHLEAGGHKGTDAHKASIVGDTVGDPFKDTAGPSLHVLVKLLNTLALIFVVLFL
jgi:K(+)-stimulated pyrophosphate-energized sodium pump